MALNEGVQKYHERIRAEKREQILEAAALVILDRGYANTPVADIAKQASVSLATFYKHFSAKPDILAALCEFIITDLIEKLDEPVHEGKSIEHTLKVIASRYAEIITNPSMRKLFRVIIAEVPNHPELGEIFYTKVIKPVHSRLYAYIRAKADEGEIQIDDEQKAAAVIMSLINQYLMLGPLYTNMNPLNPPDCYSHNQQDIVDRAVENFMKIYGKN